MRKYLSIVIPRYTETEKDIFPLLSSVSGQIGIDLSDIEVIIANDGGGAGELDGDFLALFGLDIRQVNLDENRGPGVARQAGLDAAKGEYVLFCDADDTLHNVGALGALMQEAGKSAPDILVSSWLEEIRDAGGNYTYLPHENDNTWMHGKLLRRQFLIQNGIRFHDSLRVHEDSYLLCIAAALTDRRLYLPITTYVWRFRGESITRRNEGAYTFESMPEFIRACTMAHAEIEKRVPGQMEAKVVQFTLYNYFTLHQPRWQEPKNAGHLKAAEEAFTEHMRDEWKYWQGASTQTVTEAYGQERARSFVGCMETETLGEWLLRIGLPVNDRALGD